MPRKVQTARGEMVDFDAIIIKQQLAQAPMNIEIQKRKDFIDSKEGKPRGQRRVVPTPEQIEASRAQAAASDTLDQEPEASPVKKAPIELVPNVRSK